MLHNLDDHMVRSDGIVVFEYGQPKCRFSRLLDIRPAISTSAATAIPAPEATQCLNPGLILPLAPMFPSRV